MNAREKLDLFIEEYRYRFPYPPEISPTLKVVKMFADWIDTNDTKELTELRNDLTQAIRHLEYIKCHGYMPDGEIDKLLEKYLELP